MSMGYKTVSLLAKEKTIDRLLVHKAKAEADAEAEAEADFGIVIACLCFKRNW
jgi:hypothetical protein